MAKDYSLEDVTRMCYEMASKLTEMKGADNNAKVIANARITATLLKEYFKNKDTIAMFEQALEQDKE